MIDLHGLGELAGGVLTIPVIVPLLIYSAELLAGMWSTPTAITAPGPGRLAILIPAHNEALTIAGTLARLAAERSGECRIVVVADNCSDDTASIARSCGAEVLERDDSARRGKGYALAAGRDYLAQTGTPPQVVLVLDADCRLLPGSAMALTAAARESGRPVQAVNLIEADLAAPPMIQISNFAMVVKNLIRSRGMQRLGGGALLTGTGMAFPWPLFAQARLATGSIVEDLNLGIELTQSGNTPLLVGHAHVRSKAAGMADALDQRMRWEHGILATLRQRAVPLVGQGLRTRSLALVLLGLHISVPPLALLLGAGFAVLAVLAGLAAAGAGAEPALLLGGVLSAALALTLAAWLIAGQPYLAPRTLLRLPLYLVWKLPVYGRFLKRPQSSWNRTPRPDPDA